jgi:hypothetical protein
VTIEATWTSRGRSVPIKEREIMRRARVIVFSAIIGVAVGLSGLYATALTPSPFKGSAPTSKFTAIEADDRVCLSTATTLVDIPDTTVNFTQGAGSSPVVVRFNASWPKPNAADIPAGSKAAGAFVFLYIDGQRVDMQSDNGGVLVHEGTATSVSNGTHGFEFVTSNIAAGPHTAKIMVLDNVLGVAGVVNGTVCVAERSVVVDHH